jgi:hypothetical protein
MENESLRRHYRLPKGASGVLVLAVDHGGSAEGVLRAGDVLMSIDGSKIANNATVEFRGKHRTRYDVMMGWSPIGKELELEVWRDDARQTVRFPLRAPAPLVPRAQYDRAPSYLVFGGFVFQTLTRDFLSTWESWWDKAPKEFLHLYYSGTRTADRHEVVVISQVLADEVNVGYDHLYSESIVAIDGVMPRDLADLAARLDRADGLVELRTSSDGVIVVDAAAARESTARILARYKIPRDRSLDLPPPPRRRKAPTKARPTRAVVGGAAGARKRPAGRAAAKATPGKRRTR